MKSQGDYVLLWFELYYHSSQVVKGCPGLVSLKNKPLLLAFWDQDLKAFSTDDPIHLFIYLFIYLFSELRSFEKACSF